MSALIPTISADVKARLLGEADVRQEQKVKKKPKGTPRDERLVTWLAYWSIRAVSWWTKAITLAWIAWLAKYAPKYYPRAKSFLKAHAGLVAWKSETISRKAVCDVCPYRYNHAGREWCRGENGGQGCGCGHWRPANLVHKRRLAAFKCPQGKFGYGGLVKLVVRR